MNAKENSDDLIDYVEKTHAHGRRADLQKLIAMYIHQCWNIGHRMNNTVDGWQSKFQELMAAPFFNLKIFIDILNTNNKAINKLAPKFVVALSQIQPSIDATI